MADILGNNVGAAVVPFTTADTYETHRAEYGQGGLRTVADEAARNAIPFKRREWWMLVRYLSDGSTWELVPGLSSNNLTDNDNWRQAASGLSVTSIARADLLALLQAGQAQELGYYLVTDAADGPVQVQATSAGSIDPAAILGPGASGLNQAGSYDVVEDEFTIDVATTYVRVVGDPADNNLLIGPPSNGNTIAGGGSNTIFGGESNSISGSGTPYANTIVSSTGCQASGTYGSIYSCDGCTIPEDASYVTLINCVGFNAPSGVSNVTYINNEEAGTNSNVRNRYDVPAARRQAIVTADQPAVLETDPELFGKVFVDEVYGANKPCRYTCDESAQADGSSVWKWFRTVIE